MAEIAGLKLIVPSSVAGSGVSVSASGKVSFTTTTSVSVNGVFSSTYDNYLIVCRGYLTGTAQTIGIRYRSSGTDATGSNYAEQNVHATGSNVWGGRGTPLDNAYVAGWWGNLREAFHLYVYGPALAQPTAARSVTVSTDGNAAIRDHASTHSLSTSYDGFTFVCPSTISGALTIYGLSQ